MINGPIPYAPDGNPYIGPAHGLPNFYQCCCFSFGIAQSGGAGKVLERMGRRRRRRNGTAGCSTRAATPATPPPPTCVAKAIEIYQNEYAIGFPFEERPAGRPARTTPLYPGLGAKGARFAARNGWERAAFFDPAGHDRRSRRSTLRRDRNWNGSSRAEVPGRARGRRACSTCPASPSSCVEGPGAAPMLDRLLCSRLPAPGRIGLGYALDAGPHRQRDDDHARSPTIASI